MKRMSAFLWATAVASLAAAGQARADYMNWSYSTVASPPVIASGTGSIQLTGVTNGTAGSSISLLGIQDSSAATTTAPDVFKSGFNVALTVTDNQTHDSGTLTLTGSLTGNLNANGSNVTASFAGANTLTLDGHRYIVSVPALHLTAPNTPQQALVASVRVIPDVPGGGTGGGGGPPGPAVSTPEPASLVLGGLGLSLLGMVRGWKRLRRPAALIG